MYNLSSVPHEKCLLYALFWVFVWGQTFFEGRVDIVHDKMSNVMISLQVTAAAVCQNKQIILDYLHLLLPSFSLVFKEWMGRNGWAGMR